MSFESDRPRSSASDPLGLFVTAWAMLAVIHQLICASTSLHGPFNWASIALSPQFVMGLATLLLALWTLWSPSLAAVGLLAACWSVDEIAQLPYRPNHVYVAIALNLALLASLGAAWLGRRGHEPMEVIAARRFFPTARLSLVIVYVFAAFHKLNADYFDPRVSCGVFLYGEVRRRLWFLPQGAWTTSPAIWIPLLTELIIPILLIGRRTRRWGLALGLGFHIVLGEDPRGLITSFTCMLFALYTLFLPAEFCPTSERLWKPITTRITRVLPWATPGRILVLAITTMLAVVMVRGIHGGDAALAWRDLPSAILGRTQVWRVIYSGWALVVVAGYVAGAFAMRERPSWEPSTTFFAGALALPNGLVPALLIVNALTAYLGIKTAANLSMYSNLRMDAARENHLLVPGGLTGLGYQDDLVEVLGSSNPSVGNGQIRFASTWKRPDLLIPYIELRRVASGLARPGFWIEYRRGGERLRVSFDDDPHHEVFRAPPWLVEKLLLWRPVSRRGEPQPCVW